MSFRFARIILFLVAVLAAASDARAADIYLKAQAPVHGQMVRLGDVAHIQGTPDEARQLGQVELFTVPAEERYVTARQVRESLLGRGVDLRRHTVSGASMIELVPETSSAPGDVYARRAISAHNPADRDSCNPAAAAIERFLKTRVEGDLPWKVELLPPHEPKLATAAEASVAQTERRPQHGDTRAWLGRQQFVIRYGNGSRRQDAIVEAEISLPATVVVATRNLPRGTVLDLGDLKTRLAGENARPSEGLEFAEDAVGKELVRPVRAGQIIEPDSVESTELVRRGERVAIVVKHNGVRVRTEGRARDSGGRGDAVLVESASRRTAFQAVVTGANEVQIDVNQPVTAERPRSASIR
jgi:flagella basal body P-ring formation protein FlgA